MEQHPPRLGVISSLPASLCPLLNTVLSLVASGARAFRLTILWISLSTVWKALITFTDSSADVSINDILCCSARAVPSSTVTSLTWARSLLFPTSITTTLESECTAKPTGKGFFSMLVQVFNGNNFMISEDRGSSLFPWMHFLQSPSLAWWSPCWRASHKIGQVTEPQELNRIKCKVIRTFSCLRYSLISNHLNKNPMIIVPASLHFLKVSWCNASVSRHEVEYPFTDVTTGGQSPY